MNQSIIVACPHCDKLNRLPASKLSDDGKCGSCKAALFEKKPVTLTQSSFSTHVVKSELPILVDFWAPWCGPCKMMGPVLEEAAKSLEPGIRIGKVNTEVEQTLGAQFNIRSIPTIVLYHQGKEIDRVSGAMQLPQLLQWTNNSLNKL